MLEVSSSLLPRFGFFFFFSDPNEEIGSFPLQGQKQRQIIYAKSSASDEKLLGKHILKIRVPFRMDSLQSPPEEQDLGEKQLCHK